MKDFLNHVMALIRKDRRSQKNPRRHFIGRSRTHDDAITYRMRSGFPGDVTRTHPAGIEPCLIDASAPPTIFGQPVLVDATTQGVRPYTVGDQSDSVASQPWGFVVRPFPTQQTATTNNGQVTPFTAAAPPLTGELDVMRSGYIMTQLPAGAAPVKGGQAYVWCAASSGAHVQGGVEAASSGGNTTKLAGAFFNGGVDANNIAELFYNF
jgi:hypothetical protein